MRRKLDIDLAIPSSYTANLQSLTQRTFSLNFLARSAGIFGVETIYVYKDPLYHNPEVERQIVKILRYLSTPPYLKKVLFQRDRDLSYVGMVPPLTLSSHKRWVAIKHMTFPEYRIGLVIGRKSGKYLIDVGLDKPVAIREKPPSSLVVVEITKSTSKYLIGRVLTKDEYKEINFYPGFNVKRLKISVVNFLDKYEGCRICLTRYGDYIGDVLNNIKDALQNDYERMILILGSYEYGLDKIFGYYNLRLESLCDYKINLVYDQKVETIRVEEAAMIGLSIFDLVRNIE